MSGTGLFSPTATAKAVHDTLEEAFATIPDGRSHVVMIDGTVSHDGAEARILYAQRVTDGWNVLLEGRLDQVQGLGARVATMKSW